LLIGIIAILLVQFAINAPNNAVALWSQVALNATELQVIGAILLIAATLFTLWSRLVLGTMWSSAAAVKSNHQLRTGGPYRITRHPIYTGMLGMLAGTSLILAGVWPVLLISVVIFLGKISSEERLMAEQFGEQYLEYKNRVPQLVPGLYLRKKVN
jgi:protein-S-isoprenylcysteine O-methyltransferase Ste14